MATVVKNFRIKSGLIVEGTTGTINGQNILTETGSDSYILNLVGGATLVKSVESTQLEVSGAGKLSVKSGVFDPAGSAAAAQSAAISTAASDATSKANAAAASAISAAATDAATKVAAEAALRVSGDAASVSTAAADATTKANAAQAAAISAAAADATTKANAAKAGAEATAAAALSSAISTEVSNRNTAIGAAVDSLVDGAPALLNTLNELAAAINDDANYTTTITTALGTKANSADVTTAIATAKSEAATDATTKANAAQAAAATDASTKATAAQTAAATDATTKANAAKAAAEATAAAANAAQQAGTTAFTALNISDVSMQTAAQSMPTSGSSAIIGFDSAVYRTAKATVKVRNADHTQVSELLITLDTSNNVAITEYGIVTSNGSLADVSAEYKSSTGFTNIWVTPLNGYTVSSTVILTAIK
jgi:hypothetical protein